MQFNLAYKLKKFDIVIVAMMSLVLIIIFMINGVDYEPGISEDCEACREDLGPILRAGHFEEMLWNGTQHVHNSSNSNLIQFTRPNKLLPANHNEPIKNCIDCHNNKPDAAALSLGALWVKFPRLEKKTGRIIDFEKAIQYEFVNRYSGTKPFYNEVRITEIMVYAYEKARQEKRVYDVEPDNGIAEKNQNTYATNCFPVLNTQETHQFFLYISRHRQVCQLAIQNNIFQPCKPRGSPNRKPLDAGEDPCPYCG